MATDSEVLRGAKELLSNPLKWNRSYAMAVDCNGIATYPSHPSAVKWDVYGAINYSLGFSDIDREQKISNWVRKVINSRAVGDWNDDPVNTHEDLMNLFDKAISLAKEQEDLPDFNEAAKLAKSTKENTSFFDPDRGLGTVRYIGEAGPDSHFSSFSATFRGATHLIHISHN